MPSRISASVGASFSPRSQAACMIIPGVQKPHCRPCWSQNACWSGWRLAPSAIPSMVLTSRPSAWTASIVHDLALSPSTWTVHAPQLLVSQPTCVPVSPRLSRSRWTSRRRGSTSASWTSPLTVTEMCWVLIGAGLLRVREGAFGGAAECPEGQLRGHRPLVFDRSPDVPDGAGLCSRSSACRPEQIIRGGVADQDRFGIGRGEGGVGDAGEPDPGASDVTPVVQPDHRGDADRGEVAHLALELLIGACRPVRTPDDADLCQDLGRLDGGLERVDEEVAGGDLPAPRLAPADDGRIAGDEDGRPIRGRVGMGDRTADRSPVPDLRVADRRRDVVDQRVMVHDDVELVDLAVRRSGADAQVVVRLDDPVETGHVTQVDQESGLSESELDQGDEAVAAGEQLRFAFPVRQDPEGLVQVPRTDVVELAGNHRAWTLLLRSRGGVTGPSRADGH